MDSIVKKKIAYINHDPAGIDDFLSKIKDSFQVHVFQNGFKFYEWISNNGQVDAVISTGNINHSNGLPLLKQLRSKNASINIPFIFITKKIDPEQSRVLISEGVSEIFEVKHSRRHLILRLNYLINCHKGRTVGKTPNFPEYKIPPLKRVFDIFFAVLVLICLSPILILIAILIRAESKGPVVYAAKRVGTGYRIFDFYSAADAGGRQ